MFGLRDEKDGRKLEGPEPQKGCSWRCHSQTWRERPFPAGRPREQRSRVASGSVWREQRLPEDWEPGWANGPSRRCGALTPRPAAPTRLPRP